MNMGRGGYRRNAGRKAGWRHGATKTIRVPIALREELLEISKQLDRGEYICQGTYSELNAILSAWEAKCDAEPVESGEWQKVRQLISEIQQLLSTEEIDSVSSVATDECLPPEEVFEHDRRGRRGRRERRGRRFEQFGRFGDCERNFDADNCDRKNSNS